MLLIGGEIQTIESHCECACHCLMLAATIRAFEAHSLRNWIPGPSAANTQAAGVTCVTANPINKAAPSCGRMGRFSGDSRAGVPGAKLGSAGAYPIPLPPRKPLRRVDSKCGPRLGRNGNISPFARCAWSAPERGPRWHDKRPGRMRDEGSREARQRLAARGWG